MRADEGQDDGNMKVRERADGLGFAGLGSAEGKASDGLESMVEGLGTNSSATAHLNARLILPTRSLMTCRESPLSTKC